MHPVLQIGIMLSAPLAAQLSKRYNALRLIGGGLVVAGVAAAGAAVAPTFGLLLLSRGLMGVACGPFITLASPLIDDSAPPSSKSTFLAALYLCIPGELNPAAEF
jgi:predicted MFS family arabinose efflux permease